MKREDNKKFNLQIILEIVKVATSIGTLILAFVIYYKITKPDSELNNWISNRASAREQAKLLIDLFKEDDVFKLKNAYAVFLATQKSIDTTINLAKIDTLFKDRVFEREKAELITNYTNLLIQRIEVTRKYNSFDGIGEFTIGESEIAPDITFLQSFINQQLKEIEKKLVEHGVNLKEMRAYKEYHNLMR